MLHVYRFIIIGVGITLISTGVIALLVTLSGYEISYYFENDNLLLSVHSKDSNTNNNLFVFISFVFLAAGILSMFLGLQNVYRYVVKQRKSNELEVVSFSNIDFDNLEKRSGELLGKYRDMTEELYADETSITSIISKTSKLANKRTNLKDMTEKKYIFSNKFWISSYGLAYMWNRFFKYAITTTSKNPFSVFRELWHNTPLKGGYFTYHLLRKRIVKNCNIINTTFDLFLITETKNPESKRRITQIIKNIENTKRHVADKEPRVIKNFIFRLQILSAVFSIFTFLSVFTLLGLDMAQELNRIKQPFILQFMSYSLLLIIVMIFIYWVLPQLKWYKNLVQKYEVYHGLKETETDVFTLLLPIQKTIIDRSFPEMRRILDEA